MAILRDAAFAAPQDEGNAWLLRLATFGSLMNDAPPPDQFQLLAAATGLLKPDEIAALITHCDATASEGVLTGGYRNAYRRSKVAWAKHENGFGWLYDRIWELASGFNQHFFGVEITGINEAIQIARYDETVQGGYDWHTDFGIDQPQRKISISVQLSDGADYEGGDLEFDVSTEATKVGRDKGLAVAFLSTVRHRVAPVTKGARYSLVAWVSGPRWR